MFLAPKPGFTAFYHCSDDLFCLYIAVNSTVHSPVLYVIVSRSARHKFISNMFRGAWQILLCYYNTVVLHTYIQVYARIGL